MRCQAQTQISSALSALNIVVSPLPQTIPFCQRDQSTYFSPSAFTPVTPTVAGEAEFPPPEYGLAWQTESSVSFEQRLIEHDLDGRIKREVITKCQSSQRSIDKMFKLIMCHMKSGNISTALLLFAAMESRQASQICQLVTQKMQALQQERRKVSEEIGNLKDSKQLAPMQQKLNELDGDMAIYQQIIKDMLQNKQESMELANSVSQNEHQTVMSIARR